jgi:ketosteroid isomerase-like protein
MVMRVFVAGGTGVMGRRLVPQLVARGHQVTATTTGPDKLGLLEQLGADAVVMDGLDAVSVGKAVAEARPDAIVHQMTAIAGKKPDVTTNGELAFVHSLNQVNLTLASGHITDLWLRWTACLRRIDGVWLVVHDHVSVPADLEHGHTILNLIP